MAELSGKTVLVSGAARGLGAATAKALVQDGANVVLGDLLVDEASEVANEADPSSGRTVAVRLDVRSEADWVNAVESAELAFGGLDALVNNAGVGSTRDESGKVVPLERLSLVDWDFVFDINAKGPFLGTKAVRPAMIRRGGGSIVNIASIGSIIGSPTTAYGASKGAVRSLTRAAAVNFAADNIRVNAIHPGVIRTHMTKVRLGDPAMRNATLVTYPLGRIAEPEDIVPAILYLVSDRSSFMTGGEMVIDGGLTAW